MFRELFSNVSEFKYTTGDKEKSMSVIDERMETVMPDYREKVVIQVDEDGYTFKSNCSNKEWSLFVNAMVDLSLELQFRKRAHSSVDAMNISEDVKNRLHEAIDNMALNNLPYSFKIDGRNDKENSTASYAMDYFIDPNLNEK